MKKAAAAALFCLSLFAASTGVQASPNLPAPYVSRALDAVLVELTDDVAAGLGLPAGLHGALVLAVQPGGAADANKIDPGDVITEVYGTPISKPIMVDEVVGYWLKRGKTNIGISWVSGGKTVRQPAPITEAQFTEAVDLASVSSWESYSYESFSYSEYSSQYSEEMSSSYESATHEIEQAEASEEYAQEDLSAEVDSNDDGIADSEEVSE